MPREIKPTISLECSPLRSWQGTLLGVVVDLSGSMQTNLKNDQGGQYSRIESLSQTFQRAIDNIMKLIENTSIDTPERLRLFVYGFGFCVPQQPLCDILAALKLLKKKINRYKALQSELKKMWLCEVERILEEGRVKEDAKEHLRICIEQELRDKALEAEQKRSAAKFQRWCESICFRLDKTQTKLDALLARSRYMRVVFNPLVFCLIWLLRGPTLAMSRINMFFEAWVQKKLTEYRENARKYSILLSEKVVTETKEAVDAHQRQIDGIITGSLREFIDFQCHEIIRLYDAGILKKEREEALEWKALKIIYEELTLKIGDIIRPQASMAWTTNLFKYRQAARVLRVKPNWELLRDRTVQCAHQAVWNMTEPYIRQIAEDFAKQRFAKAVLATTVQATKDSSAILSVQDLSALLQQCQEAKLSIEELPIFGPSVMGQALSQVLKRLQRDINTPKNRGLRPVVLIISDGEVIDQVNPLPIVEAFKKLGVTIVCCFFANKNIRRPWVLRRRPWWFWPTDAKLMFSMASSVDEWPEFSERLRDSRFVVKRNAKLFVQINHSEYLESFINALLLPLEKEHSYLLQIARSVE
jgi:hypothetical protein